MGDIVKEQKAFDERLPSMLKEHIGEYVVFHDEAPVCFFDGLSEAYEFALFKFGLDGVFLIEQVAQSSADISSLTWEVGAVGLE